MRIVQSPHVQGVADVPRLLRLREVPAPAPLVVHVYYVDLAGEPSAPAAPVRRTPPVVALLAVYSNGRPVYVEAEVVLAYLVDAAQILVLEEFDWIDGTLLRGHFSHHRIDKRLLRPENRQVFAELSCAGERMPDVASHLRILYMRLHLCARQFVRSHEAAHLAN